MVARGKPPTIPGPITAPIVHYEGRKLRRILWVIAAIEAVGVFIQIGG